MTRSCELQQIWPCCEPQQRNAFHGHGRRSQYCKSVDSVQLSTGVVAGGQDSIRTCVPSAIFSELVWTIDERAVDQSPRPESAQSAGHFAERLRTAVHGSGNPLSVGFDPRYADLPDGLRIALPAASWEPQAGSCLPCCQEVIGVAPEPTAHRSDTVFAWRLLANRGTSRA